MTEKKLNILFLSSWYPNRIQPTLGNFIQRHAEAVAPYVNTAVLYVCSDSANTTTYEIVQNVVNDVFTVNVYYKKVTHNFPVISQVQKVVRYIRAHQKGLKIINGKLEKVDLVHLNVLFPAGMIALYLKWFKSIPYVATEHWTGYLPSDGAYKGALRKWITTRIANTASCLIPVSNDLKQAMENHGFKAIWAIIPNVVDTGLFHPLPDKTVHPKIRIIHVSMLDEQQKKYFGFITYNL